MHQKENAYAATERRAKQACNFIPGHAGEATLITTLEENCLDVAFLRCPEHHNLLILTLALKRAQHLCLRIAG